MLIPRISIDTGLIFTSVDNQTNIRIDKLTLLIPVEHTDKKVQSSRRNHIGVNLTKIDTTTEYLVSNRRITNQYKNGLNIRCKSNNKCYLNIEYNPIKDGRSFLRIEFSPQHWNSNELDKLITKLFNFIHPKPRLLLYSAYISRVDIAIDIDKHILSNVLVDLNNARKGKMVSNSSPYGLILGGDSSIFQLSAYEKYRKINNDGKSLKGVTKGIVRIKDKDYTPFTRLEIRHHPKKESLMLVDLMTLNNPVPNIHLYDRNKVFSRKRTHVLFKEASKTMTLPEIWKLHYSDSSRQGRIKKDRMKNILSSNELDLNAFKIWTYWPDCVKKLGVLTQLNTWSKTTKQHSN